MSQDEAAKVLHSQVNFVSTNSHVNSIDSQQRCKAIWEIVHVDKSNLQDEECAALEALMKEYADLFALTSAEIGRMDLVHHTQSEVVYLGFVISPLGISADTKKVDAVNGFPVPTATFIPWIGIILSPIHIGFLEDCQSLVCIHQEGCFLCVE